MKKLITIALILLPVQAQALSASEQQDAINQQNQVIQNQRQFERERERQIDLKQVEKDQKEIQEEKEYLAKNDGKVVQDLRAIQCFRIHEIIFSQNKIISKFQEKSFVKTRIGKCLSIDQISEFGKEISNFLAKKGYATSRAEIPPQSLSDGILKIKIIESHLQKIIFNNDGFFDRTQKFTAFGFTSENEILDLQKIERGIDQINRLQSNHAVAKLLPGEIENSSIVAIENKPKDSTRLGVSYDNLGSQFTGTKRETISIAQDNLLRLNDSFNISKTANFLDHLNVDRYSESLSSSFSIPFASHKLTLNYSKSYYSFLTGSITPSRSRGYTNTRSASFDSILFKNSKFKIASTLSLSNRDNANFTNDDTKQDISSRKSSIGSVALSSTFFFDSATLFLKPSYSKGLKIMNAKKDPSETSSDSVHAQFNMFKFYGNYGHKFFIPYIKTPASYSLSFDGQYTKQHLYSNDKYFVGGIYSVRGFKNGTISEDSGYNIRNEVSVNLGQLFLPHFDPQKIPMTLTYLNKFSLTPFYDYGSVRGAHGEDNGRISGTGFRLGFNHKNTSSNLTFSRTISKSQMLLQNYRESSAIYFDFSSELGFF